MSNYGKINYNYHIDKDGYYRIKVNGHSFGIHRMILLAFNYNPNWRNLCVNHKNGINTDNRLCNLEWVTTQENTAHSMIYELHYMNGSSNPNSTLTEEQVQEICKLIQTCKYYDTEIAKMYGVSYANISDIHKGKIWRHVSCQYDLSRRKPRGLTPEQVHEICKMLEKGMTNVEIAKIFNVSTTNIRSIKIKQIWTDISSNYNF